MAQVNPTNAAILYDYLAAQQNELNIKESTKESTIKRIIWLSRYLNHKTFNEITKDDILAYLNSRIKIQIINGWALTTEHKWYFLHSSGGFTIRMNMIPKDDYSAEHEGHKEYEVKRIDDIEYRYDKFDKILIPYRETMTLYANSMKGAPIYWIRPKEPSIAKYINSRIQEIETTIDNKHSSKYQSVDTSEDFLRQLIDRYTAKFVYFEYVS